MPDAPTASALHTADAIASGAVSSAVCAAANHLLISEPAARERVAPHAGKVLHVQATVLPDLRLRVTADGLFTAEAPTTSRDASKAALTLKIDISKAAALAAQGRDVTGAVAISGDVEFASAVAWLAQNLRWEFEEDLAKAVGDAAAHRLGRILRMAAASWQQSAQGTAAMLKRGFAEPRAPLVAAATMAQFREEVDALNKAVTLLEQRLARHSSTMHGKVNS
jgi:ubiquinone biosynthesis protein UbiJ